MAKFYSVVNKGFYDDSVHAEMPKDCIPIDFDEYRNLLQQQTNGKLIVFDNGVLKAVDMQSVTIDVMISNIKSMRDYRTMTGGYQAGGHWWHSDRKSRIQQLGLAVLGSAIPQGLEWRSLDGAMVPLTPELAQQIVAAAAANDMAVFRAAEAHIAALRGWPDPAHYDYAGGWPPVFANPNWVKT